jgi:MFS family permease
LTDPEPMSVPAPPAATPLSRASVFVHPVENGYEQGFLVIFLNEDPPAPFDTPWNRPFLLINLSLFLMFTNIGLLYLYPLALKAMGGDPHTIGWVMGAFAISAVLSRPLMGNLAIQKGESWLISAGMALALVSSLSYHFITGFGPLMVLIRVIHGLGFSAVIAGSFSLVAKGASPLRRGAAFSVVGVSLMAAIALAPSAGEALIGWYGFDGLYIGAAAAVILGWLFVMPGSRAAHISIDKGKRGTVRYLPLLRDRPFFFLLCSTFIFAHGQATLANFLALIAAKHDAAAGPFFFFSYLAAIVILLTLGRFVDRYGKLPLICLSYPVFSLSILLVPGTIESPLFVVTAVMFGCGMGVLFATHNALAASHGSFREKPAVMALFTGIYDSGFITGAVVSGWAAHQVGLDMLFISSGFFTFSGLLIAMFSPMRDV